MSWYLLETTLEPRNLSSRLDLRLLLHIVANAPTCSSPDVTQDKSTIPSTPSIPTCPPSQGSPSRLSRSHILQAGQTGTHALCPPDNGFGALAPTQQKPHQSLLEYVRAQDQHRCGSGGFSTSKRLAAPMPSLDPLPTIQLASMSAPRNNGALRALATLDAGQHPHPQLEALARARTRAIYALLNVHCPPFPGRGADPVARHAADAVTVPKRWCVLLGDLATEGPPIANCWPWSMPASLHRLWRVDCCAHSGLYPSRSRRGDLHAGRASPDSPLARGRGHISRVRQCRTAQRSRVVDASLLRSSLRRNFSLRRCMASSTRSTIWAGSLFAQLAWRCCTRRA